MKQIIHIEFLVMIMFLVSGCVQNPASVNNISINNTNDVKVAPEPVKQIFEPLKLVYVVKNTRGPQSDISDITVEFYLEDEKTCNGRDCYLGIMKAIGTQFNGAMYSKITIYADTGEMASSNNVGKEEDLAFDNFVSVYNDFSIPLTLNTIFVEGGKNFNSPEYANLTSLVLLKNVENGNSLTNYSIGMQGNDATGILPCQKYKLIAKGTNVDGYYTACVVSRIGKIIEPFIVSFNFENNKGPNWKLINYSNEKSGVMFVPQCLDAVTCKYVPQLSQSAQTDCRTKSGQIEAIREENGCIKEYNCMTQEDLIDQSITRTQRPGCAINPAVRTKLLDCRKNNMPNFDVTQYDNNGCSIDVTCRK
jgi:hypothetical protein